MAVAPLLNVTTYADDYDFTCDTNEATVSTSVAELDSSTFCSNGWTERVGGLKTVTFDESGFWQSAAAQAVDPQSFPKLGTADQVFTVATAGTEGSAAYMFRAAKTKYTIGGAHGEIAPFSLHATGSNGQGAVRGALTKAKGNVSATGAIGTGVLLGAVGASQYLYGTFHIIGTPGTTVTAVLESDDNAGFSSPTTRATVGPLTTAGGTWVTRVAGAITDTYYRYRVTAITGTFSIAGAIGIGS